jgi:hypothetical protein
MTAFWTLFFLLRNPTSMHIYCDYLLRENVIVAVLFAPLGRGLRVWIGFSQQGQINYISKAICGFELFIYEN